MITGTFLDAIDVEHPSLNWGAEEWGRDFATMRADGIDTVVIACAGHADRATFDARVLKKLHPHLIVQDDQVALFLGLAEQHDVAVWFGTYQTGPEASARESEIQRELAGEVWERYGRSRAFRGWFWSRPVDTRDERTLAAFQAGAKHLAALSGLPVLVAPLVPRTSSPETPAARREQERAWSDALDRLALAAQVVLVEERGLPASDLAATLAARVARAKERKLAAWVNVESFDRDVQIHYPPIAWPKLRFKIEAALASGADKVITDEYAHFLSPHSLFNSAHMLHKRYREWLATRK